MSVPILLGDRPGDAYQLMLLAELGSGFLLAALVLIAGSGVAAWRAGRREDRSWAEVGRRAFVAGFLCVVGASATLLAALVGRDFTIAFVTEHTDRSLSLPLTVAAFYGGQEGSLLYWLLLLCACGSVALASARHQVRLAAYANVFLAGVALFFLIVLVAVASPFALLPVTPSDGVGLNPVLQDGGMLVHPPFLLAGYSAFAVPFAFAMAALAGGGEGRSWIALTRRYALVAWGLQSVGLTLGMWWAYHVLGWGGYWGWDPVENAALMPWLATTAYLHSVQVQERRGRLRMWSLVLVISAFLLSILGTFIVRSGILPSVHSFAVSPLGPWFFGFLLVAVVVSGAMLLRRGAPPGVEGGRDRRLPPAEPAQPAPSREGAFALQNLLIGMLTAAILWGTLLPLLSGMVGQELVVGPDYYQRVGAPFFVALLALLAVGPVLPWQGLGRGWLRRLLAHPLRPPGFLGSPLWAVLAMGLTLAGLIVVGVRQLAVLVTFPLVAAGLATCLQEYGRGVARWRARPWPPPSARRRYGAYLAHLGVLIVAAGLIGSHVWQQERQVTLRPGQSVTVGRHTLTYEGVVDGVRGGHPVTAAQLRMGAEILEPSRVSYPSLGQTVSRVAIQSTPLDDVYVVLTGTRGSVAALDVFDNPLVSWIWAGAGLLVLGVLVGNLTRPEVVAEPVPARSRAPVGAR
ncbi:MAG TPA: cytochrome c-type biogenesis CcmF C-terminal domain-containing protein [Candidatus Dormibacteraeota bacterium]|nr:cytochrome c-type biogenesis CcmF C-terminal domain-containing protein [Candidatus Dormibacteraeota bacterium]